MKVLISGRENLVVRLSGKLNEGAELSMVSVPQAKSIEIDLSELTLINSMGIRDFRIWAQGLQAEIMTLSFCPRFFIDQVNMVVDFLPKHAKIASFYVPYYSEETAEEKSVLFSRGQQFKSEGGQVKLDLPAVTDAAGNAMEIDTITDRYFAFLAKY